MSDAKKQPAKRGRKAEVALPTGYAQVLTDLKDQVRSAQLRAHRTVNTELLHLYWHIGATITRQQEEEGWGGGVIERLAADLRREFPEMRGLSRSNLYYMRAFAQSVPASAASSGVARGEERFEFVPTVWGQISWSHIRRLINQISDQPTRDWYAAKTVEHGWSVRELDYQIAIKLHARQGTAPSNFAERLPAVDAALMQQATKDPYVFDFLDMSTQKLERDVEQALMDRLQDTLLEFGRGFAFIGRQVEVDLDGTPYRIDLLLFHIQALSYVVVELKTTSFKPEHAGQLGFYVGLVDDKLRDPERHGPTVGILLCASRNDAAVRYSIGTSTTPIAVANFTDVPGLENLHLPEPDELTAILETPFDGEHTLGDALPDDH